MPIIETVISTIWLPGMLWVHVIRIPGILGERLTFAAVGVSS